MPVSKKKQAAANKPPKEKPLDTFIPTSYMALLEGTLLTNGDLKGSWRLKRDDVVQNDFCMVLMDRGVYDGGFNIQVAKANPSAPAVQEIHDKWHSFEWAETTKSCCNVWGRGRNKEFGEFYTIGVHDPRQRRIVIYKASSTPGRCSTPALGRTARMPPRAHDSGGVLGSEAAVIAARRGGGKRRRFTAASGRDGATGPMALFACARCTCRSADRVSSKGWTTRGGVLSENDGETNQSPVGAGSGGGPAVGEGPMTFTRNKQAYSQASGSTAGCRPTPVHIPAEATRTLPGFSGVFEEPSRSGVGVVDGGVDDLADLSILGARLQREKLRIQEDARAQRQPYVEQMSEFQGKLRKAKADEAMMLRAVQELRKKMMEDERQLESATQRVKSYEAEEQHALLLWNNKWETQVAPFIAQCEQGVKKKADELDKKTREAEMERRKLERELERLRSVKQIGDVFAQNLPR
ncbi:unnamed protein product [Scytosiphon promiscuus]